jgi:hypothetical protein
VELENVPREYTVVPVPPEAIKPEEVQSLEKFINEVKTE